MTKRKFLNNVKHLICHLFLMLTTNHYFWHPIHTLDHVTLVSVSFDTYKQEFISGTVVPFGVYWRQSQAPPGYNIIIWGSWLGQIQGRVNNSLQPSFFFSRGCIYTKVAVSTSSMNLCLSCHVTWTVLHTWLHYGISIKTMHFVHCL